MGRTFLRAQEVWVETENSEKESERFTRFILTSGRKMALIYGLSSQKVVDLTMEKQTG